MEKILAKSIISCTDQIGEGPTWDDAQRRVIWSDNKLGTIHTAQRNAAGLWKQTREWRLQRPIAAAIPRRQGGLAVAAGVEILFLDEKSGETQPFARIDADADRVSLNDAKCDGRGRLWASARAHDFGPHAGLYRIDPDGTVTQMLESVSLGNGLGWSPDSKRFYFIDTLSRSVDAFHFDLDSGSITERRRIVKFEQGAPNGMTVDEYGCLWIAATSTGQVRRYSPGGNFLLEVSIGPPNPTSCAFGGEDRGELFITSASIPLPGAVAEKLGITGQGIAYSGSDAGGLFICRPGVSGIPATPFAG